MKGYTKVFAALAIVAMMCACPLIVVSDDSHAYDVTPGESGLSTKASGLTEDQVNTLFSASAKQKAASDVFESFSGHSNISYTDIKISDMSFEKGIASSVKSDSMVQYVGMEMNYTISFKAAATADRDMVSNSNPFAVAIKAVNKDNVMKTGDFFEVTATVKQSGSQKESEDFVKNEAGNFVVTAEQNKRYAIQEYDITAKYNYTLNDQPAVVEMKFSYLVENDQDQNVKYDFNGTDPSKATADTAIYQSDIPKVLAHQKIKCTVGGDSDSIDEYVDMTMLAYIFGGIETMLNPTVHDYNLSPNKYTYVGLSETMALFDSDDVGATVNTDETMKAFLQSVGSISESYGDAKSISDDYMGSIDDDSKKKNLITYGIMAGLGVIIIVLLVLYIRKK
jgi:hypothetical protein